MQKKPVESQWVIPFIKTFSMSAVAARSWRHTVNKWSPLDGAHE